MTGTRLLMPARKAQGLPAATMPTIHSEHLTWAKKVARLQAAKDRATLIACLAVDREPTVAVSLPTTSKT
jgi:hypothetical protein